MINRYSVGWSDYRGVYVESDPSKFFVYRIEPVTHWTSVLPEKFRRYKIMCGTNVIGTDMTKDEAEAMKKLLEASRE
jgi:hypothetical protein